MSLVVLLDAGPLGMVTNPGATPETDAVASWMEGLVRRGTDVVVPEIADYEVRRELLRAGKRRGLARLDALKANARYEPLTTDVMLRAAEFWAQARKRGRPTAPDIALDADVILAAQAATLADSGDQVVVATSNVGHLSQFVEARLWQEIR